MLAECNSKHRYLRQGSGCISPQHEKMFNIFGTIMKQTTTVITAIIPMHSVVFMALQLWGREGTELERDCKQVAKKFHCWKCFKCYSFCDSNVFFFIQTISHSCCSMVMEPYLLIGCKRNLPDSTVQQFHKVGQLSPRIWWWFGPQLNWPTSWTEDDWEVTLRCVPTGIEQMVESLAN